MGRSFFKPSPANTIEDYSRNNHYFHGPSNIHYQMIERNGAYYQKHYQIGVNGEEANALEERIDYVLGSGNHARSYLHRTTAGTLVQLPLGWYAEKGGYWAMSPGYDAPDHPGSRRPIGNDCMFCHNAYPVTRKPAEHFGDAPVFDAELPQGIDCRRCHGPAENHAVNPARFTPERSMEVCMQCHLEPDSLSPTLNFKRYGKSWSSWKPGEALSDFMLFFEASSAKRADDKFQIAGAAYEFRKSACFLRSGGKFQCTTCHDPHEARHGTQAAAHYNAICTTCHATLMNHQDGNDCVRCHMPKRRTTDVVHVVMTDHYLRRTLLKGDLLADITEQHGAPPQNTHAELYYPAQLRDPLYLAMARLRNGEGAAQALPGVRALRPAIPDPWFEIAEAERKRGRLPQAVGAYRSALALMSDYVPAVLGLGAVLRESHQNTTAAEMYTRALQRAPGDARIWNALGQTQLELNSSTAAVASFGKSATLDPSYPDPHNWLGIVHAQAGHLNEAEAEFHAALKLQPNYAEAHANLANLLALEGYTALASTEFDAAISISASDTAARISYAELLTRLGRFDAARVQLEQALERNPRSAHAHDLLGNALERAGQVEDALRHYEQAVDLDPGDFKAQLDLGAVLHARGDATAGLMHLSLAAKSPDPGIRNLALDLLRKR